MGCYLWARTGLFEFDGSKPLQALKEGFDRFAARHGIAPEQARALSSTWTHPYHIAIARVPGLKIETRVGNQRPRKCDIGKAFLMSEDAPPWHGFCRVNQPPGPEARTGLRALRVEVAVADRSRARVEAGWMQTLLSGDENARRAALTEIGRRGGPEWAVPLSRFRSDPSIGEAASRAMRDVGGESLTENLRRIALDVTRSSPERQDALGSFTQFGGRVSRDMARCLADGDDDRLRHDVMRQCEPELAQQVALAVLARNSVDAACPFQGRSAHLDAMRILMDAHDTIHLETLKEADPMLKQAALECLDAARGGEKRGVAALNVGEYPEATWTAVLDQSSDTPSEPGARVPESVSSRESARTSPGFSTRALR